MWLIKTLGISWAQQPTDPPLNHLCTEGKDKFKTEARNPGQAKILTPQPALLLLVQRTIPINCLTKSPLCPQGPDGK